MEDLKIIKKKYGEKMFKFVRENFSSYLDDEGLLSSVFERTFYPDHKLYDCLEKEDLLDDFVLYINSFITTDETKLISTKNPFELMKEAGYKLYECKTEDDIQKFQKYYTQNEKLCTFRGNRLDTNYVFFAIKNNVKQLNRKDFLNPKREDEYGTSVISIQITKNRGHVLSIKNRYNHHVSNPDNTFNNNLENIIPTLTDSFEKYMGFNIMTNNNTIEIRNCVRACDEKYYRYNREIDNVYYCPNNIIIDNFKVLKYDKEKFIVINNYILNLVDKKIYTYNKENDVFLDTLDDINNIEIIKDKEYKIIILKYKDKKDVKLILDHDNNLIGLDEPNITEAPDYYLGQWGTTLEYVKFNNLKKAGDSVLGFASKLRVVHMPKLVIAGNQFIRSAQKIKTLTLPELRVVGEHFMSNSNAEEINLPKLEYADIHFLDMCPNLISIYIPKLKNLEYGSLSFNSIYVLNLNSCREIHNSCLLRVENLEEINAPVLEKIADNILMNNKNLKTFFAPLIDEDNINKYYYKNKTINEKKSLIKKLRGNLIW